MRSSCVWRLHTGIRTHGSWYAEAPCCSRVFALQVCLHDALARVRAPCEWVCADRYGSDESLAALTCRHLLSLLCPAPARPARHSQKGQHCGVHAIVSHCAADDRRRAGVDTPVRSAGSAVGTAERSQVWANVHLLRRESGVVRHT